MDLSNWVERRAACSIVQVFAELEMGVKGDIEERNRLRTEGETVKFEFASTSGRFRAIRNSQSRAPMYAEFSSSSGYIVVEYNNGTQGIRAHVTLNDEGECRLRHGSKELEYWQFRRIALEALFFDQE